MDAVPGIPFTKGHPNGSSPYVRHLGSAEVGCGRHDGSYHPCPFEMFVRVGLPLAECLVLGEEAHREFMVQSGLSEDLLAPHLLGSVGEDFASRALRMRLAHLSSPIEGELNQQICEALIGLGATSVAVVSEGLIERGLKSIPEVKDAIREAWLSPEGLKRQVEASSRGEGIPLWPVSILAENAPRQSLLSAPAGIVRSHFFCPEYSVGHKRPGHPKTLRRKPLLCWARTQRSGGGLKALSGTCSQRRG